MADFLSEKLQEIDNRLKELRPLHEEYLKLERAKQALEGMDSQETPRRRGPGRPRGSGSSSTRSTNGRRRRRSRAGGTAAEKVLEVVRQNPGVTVSEVGDQLGYTQKNYLYRVFHNLTEDGAVQKQGKGYVAA
jgi:AraC-like DNA-binding protein